jgi:AP2 domain
LKGTFRQGHRWRAAVKHNGKRIYLGYFGTPEAAHEAYGITAKEIYGEFFYAGNE